MSLTGHNQRRRHGRVAARVEHLDRRALKALLARHGVRPGGRESAARLRQRARRILQGGGR